MGAVSGETHPEAMRKKLEQPISVLLKVVRPATLTMKLGKGDSSFGLRLAFQSKLSSCLRIDEIGEGAVEAFNASADADSQSRTQDLIASVNGVAGTATTMAEEFSTSNVVELVVLRVP